MREIKFRGKRFYNNKWVYGNLFIDKDGERYILENDYLEQDGHHLVCNSDTPVFMMEETIGQYTGLKDKNGLEIYEGDILGCIIGGCPVVWVERDTRFGIDVLGECKEAMLEEFDNDELEVIGNIYDDPELLEGDNHDTQD